MSFHFASNASLVLGLCLPLEILAAQEVLEPAGAIPVAQQVDVVVVGGGAGGVAAALAAAQEGARVFVAAPRPYLGEDICASSRLWLEPGEEPTTDLARLVFEPAPLPLVPPVGPGIPFQYAADQPSANPHKDTAPPSLLSDGKWQSAPTQSVQYDGDVTLWLDLGCTQAVRSIHVMVYQRPADFEVAGITVSASLDRQAWTPCAQLENDRLGAGQFEGTALTLSGPAACSARYLKLETRKSPDAHRILLGEVLVEGGPESPAPPPSAPGVRPITPMQVKRTLDQALIKAGISFLYASPVTDLLRDSEGHPAGIVIANRSGRQALPAKIIIDATERAIVARMAGARFSPYPAGTHPFSRTVVGGPPRQGDNLTPQPSALRIFDRKGEAYPVLQYQLQVPMPDDSFRAFAEAEQLARDWTWTKEAVDASEVLFQVPPDSFRSREPVPGAWPGADKIPLGCFAPAGVERLFVLGGCADVSRDAAAQLVRPVNLMAVGSRLGMASATLARSHPDPTGVRSPGSPSRAAGPGQARAAHDPASPRVTSHLVPAEARGLPVLGEYDVVVVGGGTGGAPAGIGAGRQGARTLLVEYLHGLGGVGTLGYISSYYHGNRVGFTREVDEGVAAFGGKDPRTSGHTWNPEHKSEWYRRALRKAGVEIWFGALGTGALVENDRVIGVLVVTPQGRGVVRARVVIDSTGNADIAAAAGATCRYTDASDVAVQGTGLPPRQLGQHYTNTDYTFVDDTDVYDLWRVLVTAKEKFKGAYDLGQLIDTRERRQIVGDLTLSPMDMILARTHPDTLVIARSNFDTHGYIVHPMFMIRPPHRADLDVRVPYRCLIPRGLDGILVTGLGVSAHRDALPVIRMQPDIQNQGYAAGVAAAMIARQNTSTRQLDVKALQQHLVDIGNLPPSVLTETDSFPLPAEKVADAVRRVAQDYDGLEIVLARFDVAQPLLRDAFAQASSEPARLAYAHILGMMGDPTGAGALAQAVGSAPWDEGWRYTGMGQFGPSMSPLDSFIIALGRTRSPLALQPIVDKLEQLQANSEFSHFRAVALALETLADPAAAPPLAQLLRKPGLSGHAITTIQAALQDNPANATDTTTRNRALSELYLARALYRCGDHENLGRRILQSYAQDLHGHYARHAQAVLALKDTPPGR